MSLVDAHVALTNLIETGTSMARMISAALFSLTSLMTPALALTVIHPIPPTIVWRPSPQNASDASCREVVFDNTSTIAIDSKGNLYLGSDILFALWRISGEGNVQRLLPIADRASRSYPEIAVTSVAIDENDQVIVGNEMSHVVGRLRSDGILVQLAGRNPRSNNPQDRMDGPPGSNQFANMGPISVDSSGNIYVVDNGVRKLTRDGKLSTLPDLDQGLYPVNGKSDRAAAISGIAVDSAGNLFVAVVDGENFENWGIIRKVAPSGILTTIAGNANAHGRHLDGVGHNAQFGVLGGIAVDHDGNLFVTENSPEITQGSFPYVRKIDTAGRVSTVFDQRHLTVRYINRFTEFLAIAVDPAGRVYVVDSIGRVHRIDQDGSVNSPCEPVGYVAPPRSDFRTTNSTSYQ